MKDSQKLLTFHAISILIIIVFAYIAYINFDKSVNMKYQGAMVVVLLLGFVNILVSSITYDQIIHERKYNI